MQITLNQDEIHEAVENYVRGQITIATNQTIDIDFTAGRGSNGLSATLDIRSSGSSKKTRIATATTTVAPVPDAEEATEVDDTAEAEEIEDEDEDKLSPFSDEEAPKVNRSSIFANAKSA